MKEKSEEEICPECGQRVTEEDKNRGNVRFDNGKMLHKKCRLIRK